METAGGIVKPEAPIGTTTRSPDPAPVVGFLYLISHLCVRTEWLRRSFAALPKRANIGADARGVHPIVTEPLAAGRAHVDATSGHVTGDPDYDGIAEPEPAGLLSFLEVARVGIGGHDGPARHRFRDVKGLVERLCHRQGGLERCQIGVGYLLELRDLWVVIIDPTRMLSGACR